MCQQTRQSLFQIIACRLLGAKPLSEPVMAYYYLESWKYISMNLNQSKTIFVDGNKFENVVCKIASILHGPHCVQDGHVRQ